jgi:hypothetical protein
MSEEDCLEQKYEERLANFARVRAMILKIVNQQPSLTVEEISKQFLLQYRFLPRIDNRLRELRAIGYVDSRLGEDGKLHWNAVAINK